MSSVLSRRAVAPTVLGLPRRTLLQAAVVGAALAAVSAIPVHGAQCQGSGTRPIRIGIGGGTAVPVGDFKDRYTADGVGAVRREIAAGVNALGFVEFAPGGLPVGVRATVSYNRFGISGVRVERTGVPGGVEVAADGYSQILAGLANVKLALPAGPIRPYVIAGLGAFSLQNEIERVGGTGTGTGPLAASSASSTRFGVDGGAGVELRLGGISAFVEARVANVYTSQEKFGSLASVRYVPLTFGLVF